jgi:hypothetical protein
MSRIPLAIPRISSVMYMMFGKLLIIKPLPIRSVLGVLQQISYLVALRTNLIKYVKAPWTNIQISGIGGG